MTTYSTAGGLSLTGPPVSATLLSMAQALQSIVESAALAAGVALPERRVTYMAPTPADCPQVAFLIGGWQLEPSAEGMIACNRGRWAAQLGVVITRKTPAVPGASGDLPKPAQLEAAAQMASDDAEVLIDVVSSLSEVADVIIETPAAEGGLQSTTLAFRAAAFGGV